MSAIFGCSCNVLLVTHVIPIAQCSKPLLIVAISNVYILESRSGPDQISGEKKLCDPEGDDIFWEESSQIEAMQGDVTTKGIFLIFFK